MNLHSIPCFLIHRQQDTIREASILELEKALDLPLQRFEAFSGLDGLKMFQLEDFPTMDGFPRKHPNGGQSNEGVIGCTASHIKIIKDAIASNQPYCCIFEDDAEVVGNLDEYFTAVDTLPPADIIILGCAPAGKSSTSCASVEKIEHFWLTHALVINRHAMIAILDTFICYVEAGYALPADWLYSYAIGDHKLVAYAPVEPVIRQRPGFVSLTS